MAAPAAPLLLEVFSTFDPGGAQTRFVSLANHFGPRLRHIVVAMDGQYGALPALLPNLDLKQKDVPVTKGQTLVNRRNFRRILDEIRPDILITHNWGTIEWAMANWPRRVRHIHMEDGFGPDEAERQLPRRVWTRRLLLRGSSVVVPSRNLRRIAREIWRLPDRGVQYIPNGIDCAKFARPVDPSLTSQWLGDGPTIGIVAALRAEKNVARVIRAFALIAADTPGRLIIVGEGAERPRLERMRAEAGLQDRITLTGNVAGTERVYGGFQVFALTSDTEQMPYTVLEAMAASLPAVTTDVGDIRHMVAKENLPFLVPKDDQALAAALRALLADPALQRRIGAANREKALAEYDETRMFSAYADLYEISA